MPSLRIFFNEHYWRKSSFAASRLFIYERVLLEATLRHCHDITLAYAETDICYISLALLLAFCASMINPHILRITAGATFILYAAITLRATAAIVMHIISQPLIRRRRRVYAVQRCEPLRHIISRHAAPLRHITAAVCHALYVI